MIRRDEHNRPAVVSRLVAAYIPPEHGDVLRPAVRLNEVPLF
jgi:hypothetical protein